MELYAVIGKPLSHSMSADYFTRKFASAGELDLREYRKIELENIEELPAMVAQNPNLRGFNVTHPYKEQIIPHLTSLSEEARKIGAVNCVRCEADGSLVGYNTDFEGMRGMILGMGFSFEGKKIVILGTGGTSHTARAVAKDLGAGEILLTSMDCDGTKASP